MARQADGKSVVAGITTGSNGSDIAVARILPGTGQLDPSFSPGDPDGDGRLVLDLGGSDVAEDALLQPDGKIVLAGRQQIGSQDILVVRLTADGAPDPGFDGDGVARANGADDKIVVAGSAGQDHAVVRLQPGGSPDTTFSGDGLQTFGFPGAPSGAASGPALGADGAMVTAGVAESNDGDVAVARLRATRRADVIAALGGGDTVTALGGDDVVCGGAGKDLLRGGPGRDRLLGQAGNDRLLGGPGSTGCSARAGATR